MRTRLNSIFSGSAMFLAGAALAAVVGIGVFVNLTSKSVEEGLPATVFEQSNDIALIAHDFSTLLRAVETARLDPSQARIDRVLDRLDVAINRLQRVRSTYNFDNLVDASSMHAIVNPALTDIARWLSEGLPGIAPTSDRILRLVQIRAQETHDKVERQYEKSTDSARKILAQQAERLHAFREDVKIPVAGTAILSAAVIVLIIIQLTSNRRRHIAEAALRESDARLMAIMENSPVAITLKDNDGRFLAFNRHFLERRKLKAEDVVGKTIYDINRKEDADKTLEQERLVLDTGMAQTFEVSRVFRDADERTLMAIRFPVIAEDSEHLGIGSVSIDITDRKQAEQAVARSDQRLRDAVESLQEGFALFDAEDRLVLVNSAYKLLNPAADEAIENGWRFEDILRANVKRGVLKEAVGREEEFIRERVEAHLNPGHPFVRTIGKNRKLQIRETRTPDGGIALSFVEITDIVAAQRREAQTHQRFFDAIETVPVAIALFDADDHLVEFNKIYDKHLDLPGGLKIGMTFEEIARASVARGDVIEAIDREEDWIAERIEQHRKPGALLVQKRKNEWLEIREYRAPNGDTLLVAADITEQRHAEERLRESRQMLQLVLDAIPVRVFWKDRDLRYLGCNRRFAADAGLNSPDDIIGKSDLDMNWIEQAERYRADDLAVIEDGKPKYEYEEPQTGSDGSIRWLQTSKAPLPDADGEIIGILGCYEDITERKRAQEALFESEAQLRTVLESAAIGIGIDLLDGRTIQANPALQKLLGYSAAELLRMRFTEYTHPSHTQIDASLFQEMVDGKRNAYQLEKRYIRKDGEIVWGRLTRSLFFDMEGNPRYALGMLEDITERKRTEESLRESEERFRNLIEGSLLGIVVDRNGVPVFANQAFAEMFGYDNPEEILALGSLDSLYPPNELERVYAYRLARTGEGQAPTHYEFEGVKQNGVPIWLETQVRVVNWGGSPAIQSTVADISTRQTLMENLTKLSMAVEQSPATVMITDVDGQIEYVNPKFVEITGYEPAEVIGKNPRFLKSGRSSAEHYEEMWRAITSGKEWRGEFQNKRKDGALFWEFASISPIKTPDGTITHFLAVKEDITLRKEYEQQLVRQANFDEVTGLPNRFLAFDRLSQAFVRARRGNSKVALLFIDLDRFKRVNDTLGHPAGDAALKSAGQRISSCLRAEDTVSRFGGDEFVVILAGVGSAQDTKSVVEKIQLAFSQAMEIGESEVFISPSIGISLWPEDGEDPETLVRNADTALLRAKSSGRNTYSFFTPEMDKRIRAQTRIENQLRPALEQKEFYLHYQPIIDIADSNIVRAEALLRWNNSELGAVSPADFIPIAEEIGLIVPIGDWVMKAACLEAASWPSSDTHPFTLAVNVSTRQFRGTSLVEGVGNALRESGFAPERLEIEITESLLMGDIPEVTKSLGQLKDLGIKLSVDDFGTGYSSLSYLRRFPVDVIKIDRSFVMEVMSNPDNATLVETIVNMAHSLKLQVVAEGVETEEQLEFLRGLGCDFAQGFLFSRPLSAADFRKTAKGWSNNGKGRKKI
jgi:diguanylate cyclase (GGDEF)-like protein/PAS domain S-box-containing protein